MTQEEQYDAIIAGAGFSGIYQLVQLRQLGLRCTVIEAGSDLGGVWYWNTYPGARVDFPIPFYELSLPELWKEWTWSDKYAAGPELQAYFRYVGDKMGVRPYCRFDTMVKQAHWDETLHMWHITAEGKQGLYRASSRYFILCTGYSSKPYIPDFKGRETFKGQCLHTSQWPKEGIEMAGKRVAVVGTGASGVQVIQEIGPQVAHLTVFQRTPNMTLPMRQYKVSKQMQDHFKPIYAELYNKLETTFGGVPGEMITRPALSDSEEEREATFERLWDLGGLSFLLENYHDILFDKSANEVAYAFWRKKVSGRVNDPRKRALLAPEVPPHPISTKRHSLEQHYYEVFNQDNVDLVDLRATPIAEINENGIKTSDKQYELDVIVLATGHDSYIGGITNIDLRGLDGKTIQDHWKDGVTTYLGMSIDSFPNLFFAYGPQAPTAFCVAPTCLQLQTRWIAQTIEYLRGHGITKFMPTAHAALKYKKHIEDMWNATLLPQTDSWYTGANIPGKKREAYNYMGGVPAYVQEIQQEVVCGYPGFTREVLARYSPKASSPSQTRL